MRMNRRMIFDYINQEIKKPVEKRGDLVLILHYFKLLLMLVYIKCVTVHLSIKMKLLQMLKKEPP